VPQNAGAEHHPATSFSWDIICGFPGETPELFAETCALIKELKPIHIHAFPFSPRPGTLAATMPNQVARAESKRRVRIVNELARENRRQFMRNFIGSTAQVLMEENNFGRTEDDIPVRVAGAPIPERTIIDVVIEDIENDLFIGLPL
jgi:threonylcarbamoyladenosine tRNA methylthiotransferase MtaB